MKTRFLLCALLATCTFCKSFAQTNLDLETWTGSAPNIECDGWGSINSFSFLGAPQSLFQETVDPGEALSSAKTETVHWVGATSFGAPSDTISGFLTLGGSIAAAPAGIPYTSKPTDVSFMYKANVQPGDESAVFVQLSHYSGTATVIDAQAVFTITGASGWQNVTLPLTYFTTDTPDTLQINCFSSSGSFLSIGGPPPIIGSQLFVDNFSINFCAGPTASFTSSSGNLTAFFVDGSTGTGSLTYSWDFGDGAGTSGMQNPIYTYSTSGTYTACLTVSDSCGSTQFCQSVTVAGGCINPVAGFSFTTNGLSTTFTDGSTLTGTTYYYWDFDDGNSSTGTSLTTTSNTYAGAGTYNVCLTVTDSCGTDSVCQNVTVGGGCPAPVASFGAGSVGLIVVFADSSTGSGTISYSWDFGDGSGNATTQNPTYAYASQGTYLVCLQVFDSCGTSNAYCQNITVPAGGGCPAPIASFSTTSNGLFTTFTDASTLSLPAFYTWEFGDGTTNTGIGLSSTSNTYASAGIYNVCLTVTDSCGSDSTCQNISVSNTGCNMTVIATATDETSAGMSDGAGSAFVSNGTAPYTYIWSDGQTTATASGLAPGTYSVTVTDANACVALTTITVLAGAVNCQIQIAVTATDESSMGGNNGTAMAVVTGGTQPFLYLWNTGATTSSISNLAPGVYSCTVLDADQCQAGGTTVVQNFQCTLGGTMSSTDETAFGAFDGTATISASGGTAPYTYAWSTFETTSTISNLGAGIYDVTVTDASGCTYAASAAINPGGVNCNLSVTVSGTAESQLGSNDGTASVSVTGGAAPIIITWDTGDTTTTISNLTPGDYTVVIQDGMACFATATYTVSPGLIIGVPEQITPVVSVKVYPNPAVDMINFEINSADQGVLYVFDFAGRQVKEVSISESLTEINTEDLGSGMYFYQLMGMKSNKLGSGKFVILK